MAKARALVGLDVRAAKVIAAMLDAETGALRFERLRGEVEAAWRSAARLMARCGRPMRPG